MSAIKATLSTSGTRRRRILAVVIGLCLAAGSVAAWAFWSAGATSAGSGASKGGSVNQGATPTASATGRKVTVSWGASTLSTGGAVDGYIVKRYDASTDALQTMLTDCTGTIAALTCDEKQVPLGDWKYTVTPKFATNWTGAESAKSGTVTVTANKTLTLDKSTFGTADLSGGNFTVTGTLAGFDPDETLAFKLDDASTGTDLSGTPAAADGDGNATISVTLPQPSDGAHTIYVNGGNGSQTSAAIVVDTAAPTASAQLSPAANGAGWNNTSPVSVTLSGDDGTGSGLKFIKYTTDGSDPTTSGTAQTYSAPFDVSSTSTVKFFAEDNAGNDESVQSQDVKIDTTAPDFGSPALTLSASGSFAAVTGTTAFYNPAQNTGSSITVNAPNVSDPGSGIAKVNFPAITDFTGGGDDTTSAYSSTYNAWTNGTSTSGSQTVTAYNNADLSDNSATFTLTPDSTAPSTPDAPTVGAANANGYFTATSIPITLPSTTPTDTGSGLAGQQLQRQSVTLSGGTCGTFDDSAGATWNNVTLHSGADTTGVASGNCYRYRELASDRVANSTPSVVSATAKVDTSAPTVGAATITESDASDFVSGTTVFYNPQGTNTGSFKVQNSDSDTQSGIQKVAFPSLGTGFTGGGDVTTPDTGTTYSSTYTWDASQSPAATGSKTITATNGAGSTGTTTFTVTPDTTNPVNGTITVASGSTTGTYTGTKTNYADGTGSGMASNVLTRETATLTNGTCGTFGSLTTIASISETSAPSGCYRYTLTGTDNVGNVSSTSQIVQVDSTKPDFGSPALTITADNDRAFVSGTTVWVNNTTPGTGGQFTVSAPNIADPESGITKVNFPSITGLGSGGDDTTPSPYSSQYTRTATFTASTTRTVTATNGATNTQTTTFTTVPDAAAPTGGSVAANTGTSTGAISGFLYNSSGTYALNRTDYTETQNTSTASGLASSTLTVAQGTYDPTGTTAATVCKNFGSESSAIVGAPSVTGATEGCYRYTLTGTDNVGNAATSTVTVVVDQTAPSMSTSPANVQLVNGGTAAQAGQLTTKADHVDITFPEAMKVSSICSNWTSGDGTDQTISGVTVTITDGTVANGNNDVLTISGGCTTGHFGSIDLGSNAYVSGGNVTFSGSGNNTSKLDYTASTHKLVLSLGAAGGTGTIGAVINSSTAIYTPNSLITDSAGNAITGTFNTGAVKQF